MERGGKANPAGGPPLAPLLAPTLLKRCQSGCVVSESHAASSNWIGSEQLLGLDQGKMTTDNEQSGCGRVQTWSAP